MGFPLAHQPVAKEISLCPSKAGCPNVLVNGDHLERADRFQCFPRVSHIAVGAIVQNRSTQTVGLSPSQQFQGNLPFRLEVNRLGHTRVAQAFAVVGPLLGDIEGCVDTKHRVFGGALQRHGNLTIADLAHGSQGWQGHSYGVCSLLGEAGVIKYQRDAPICNDDLEPIRITQFGCHFGRKSSLKRVIPIGS